MNVTTAMGKYMLLCGLWTVLLSRFVRSHMDHGDDCGTPNPKRQVLLMEDMAEMKMFGRQVERMSPNDLSSILQSIFRVVAGDTVDPIGNDSGLFQLVDIPIVFHILPNQDNGGEGSPSFTERQQKYTIETTNLLYNVYDRVSKKSVQFSTFVADQTIVHKSIDIQVDCDSLDDAMTASIVKSADEWQFKFHLIVCETSSFSGRASFPSMHPPTDPLHNVVLMDYRALACYDDLGNFLCETKDGNEISHTRWWRTRSAVLAHEIGHCFGLFHTFQNTCLFWRGGDGVADTPAQATVSTSGCPGLLPYDKDRDLYAQSLRQQPNKGANASSCPGEVCGETCGACCTPEEGQSQCTKYATPLEPVTEEVNNYPHCCLDEAPLDTCRFLPGVDPLNNVMSYIPDYCAHEFTPGQLVRMMAQVREHKRYIYCNYGNVVDSERCVSVPCGSSATSPNCSPK